MAEKIKKLKQGFLPVFYFPQFLFEHFIFFPFSTIKELHLGHFSPVGLSQRAKSQSGQLGQP